MFLYLSNKEQEFLDHFILQGFFLSLSPLPQLSYNPLKINYMQSSFPTPYRNVTSIMFASTTGITLKHSVHCLLTLQLWRPDVRLQLKHLSLVPYSRYNNPLLHPGKISKTSLKYTPVYKKWDMCPQQVEATILSPASCTTELSLTSCPHLKASLPHPPLFFFPSHFFQPFLDWSRLWSAPSLEKFTSLTLTR